MDQYLKDFIEHHGVRGMKWGVRKARSARPVSGDAKKVNELKTRKPHQLTNKQLKDINERQRLERQFIKDNPSKTKRTISTGQAAVGTVLAVAGTAAAVYSLQHNPAVKAVVSAGKKHVAEHKAEMAKMLMSQTGQLTLF